MVEVNTLSSEGVTVGPEGPVYIKVYSMWGEGGSKSVYIKVHSLWIGPVDWFISRYGHFGWDQKDWFISRYGQFGLGQ